MPEALAHRSLTLADDGHALVYRYDGADDGEGAIADLLGEVDAAGITFKDLHTRQSSLEEIFVNLVKERT